MDLPLCCIPLQAYPFFKGVEWNKLYQMEAAFIPEVNDELDTQNFEKFDEVFESLIFLFCVACCRPLSLFIFSHFVFCICSLTAKLNHLQDLVHGGR